MPQHPEIRTVVHRRRVQWESRAGGMGIHPPSPGQRQYRRIVRRRTGHDQQSHGAHGGDRRPLHPQEACRVELITDSQYVAKGISEWMPNWKRQGWMRKEGGRLKPVINLDLWQRLDSLLESHRVKVTHVLGHRGHPENEACDRWPSPPIRRIKEFLNLFSVFSQTLNTASTMLKLIDLVVERLEADAQFPRGRRLVAVVFLQDGLDVLHLDVAEGRRPFRDLEMRRADGRRGGRVGLAADGELSRQVFGQDRPVAREDRGAFDHVAQLTNVPGPVVILEDIEGFRDDRRLTQPAT